MYERNGISMRLREIPQKLISDDYIVTGEAKKSISGI